MNESHFARNCPNLWGLNVASDVSGGNSFGAPANGGAQVARPGGLNPSAVLANVGGSSGD